MSISDVHWLCNMPTDEKMKLNLPDFYKFGLNVPEGETHRCTEDLRQLLDFEKKGPYLYRLFSPLEQEPKCLAIDLLFKEPVSVGEIKFQNYYTAYINVLMKVENHRNWETMVDHTQLMPYPHFETNSRQYFKFTGKWDNITEIRFILRQPSPNWKRFSIENLIINREPEEIGENKNYLTYLIRKTTEALKMEHKNDKNSSSIPFHIGTYGYEIDKLIRF